MYGVPFAKQRDGTYVWGPYTIQPGAYDGTSTRYTVHDPAAGRYYRARSLEDAKQVIRDLRDEVQP